MGDDGHVWETHPVTPERFDDFADVVNPNRRENHCWCLSHRCTAGEIAELGEGREEAMRALTEAEPQGVVTYRDGVPVASAAPPWTAGLRSAYDPGHSRPPRGSSSR